jgi:hypothetical protein
MRPGSAIALVFLKLNLLIDIFRKGTLNPVRDMFFGKIGVGYRVGSVPHSTANEN